MGTDYNAIVNERNQTIATVKPKAQPSNYHAIGSHKVKLKNRTGNGDDAHLWPAKRYVDYPASETDRERNKHRSRNERLRLEKLERQNGQTNN